MSVGTAVLAFRRFSTVTASSAAPSRHRLLVLHGYGIDTRGYEQIEKFGTQTLADYNTAIQAWARQHAINVTAVQSNDAAHCCSLLASARATGFGGSSHCSIATAAAVSPHCVQPLCVTSAPTESMLSLKCAHRSWGVLAV